jgi:DNA helicase-2/ATP-dependent DNA helicase PcrA
VVSMVRDQTLRRQSQALRASAGPTGRLKLKDGKSSTIRRELVSTDSFSFCPKCYNENMKKEATKTQSETLKGLNKQQLKAVTFGEGPLLIIAGAGTGKTTVLTRRIVWLIEKGLVKPEEILALTFTEKAANEMSERVDLLMPLGYSEIQISTFHSFAQKILSQHALDIGLPGDFKVLTDTQAWMLMKKNLYDFDLDYYKPIGNPNKFIHSLLKHFSKAKGEEITPEDYLKYAESLQLDKDNADIQEHGRIKEVANAYHKYQKLLLDEGCLDFGDLINYTLKLFRTRPKILELYQNQFKYLLVDEFQDTDLSQYELVRLLAKPENNITVVGDDDQSIYKFRGASISNILKFKEDYKNASEVTLTENYRSTQKILDLSYSFIQQNNPERLEAKLKISKKLTSDLNETGEISVLHTHTVYQEATQTIDKILGLMEKEKFNFNDFAILVRANDHAEPFISELSRRGIPYTFVANRGLYKKPFILDLLAYFRLLDNYYDNENWFRIFTLPKFKIPEEQLISFSQTAKKKALSLFEVIKDSQLVQIKQLLQLIEKHMRLSQSIPASELLVKVLDDLDLAKGLLMDSIENVENRSLVEQFYRKILKYQEENDSKTIKGFLHQIKLELDAGDSGQLAFNPDIGPETVKVMTVHSAKGLEFACVFVVNMVDQRFPSRARSEQIEIPTDLVKEILPEGDVHLMEERRLFYVAATRAKRFLYLTWADDYGGAANKKPSRFLIELGLEQPKVKAGPAGEVFFTKQPVLLKVKTKLQLPEIFSFSQISCFLHCPLEYKYKYIYHLPLPGEAQLSFGVTIHKTLEKYLQNMIQINSQVQPDLFNTKKSSGLIVPKKELLAKFYEESWVDDWFPDKINKEEYRKRGLKMLEHFYEKFSQNPKLPKFLERSFKLRIGKYKFVGKIDRGDQNKDGTIDIIDYKTGAVKEKLSTVDKEQLMIYQWAAQEEFGEKVNSLSYWFLNSLEDSGEFVGDAEEIEKVKDKLLKSIEQIIETIQTGNFTELDRRTSHDCKFRHLES